MTTRKIVKLCPTCKRNRPIADSMFCAECQPAPAVAAPPPKPTPPPRSEQVDLLGVPVEYALPPEVQPTPKDRQPSWLAERSSSHSEGWRKGVIEGALWVIGLRLDDHELRVLVLAELRRRFGAHDVDERLRVAGVPHA